METSSEVLSHLTAGAMVVYFIEWAKKSQLTPWLTFDTKRLNQITSALLAAIAVVGISYSYDPSADGGTLIIHGLSWSSVAAGFWEWAKQFTAQQLIFDGVVAPKTTAKGQDK